MRQKHSGNLIVLEGTDGAGKNTQLNLLAQRLQKTGASFAFLSFPQYGKKSAGLIEAYLNGAYGKRPEDVSPEAASLFFALDRFDASFWIREQLECGRIVILDRYVDSNAAHQGGKIAHHAKRKKFLAWLYDMEYRILAAPKPDMVIILHVPAGIGQKLVEQKRQRAYLGKKTRDIHEVDIAHLKNAEAVYLSLAELYPENHLIIECMEDGQLLPPEDIHEKIWKVLEQHPKGVKI